MFLRILNLKKIKHNNLFFSQGIDLVYEFFNLERKLNSNLLGKSLQVLGRNAQIKIFLLKLLIEEFLCNYCKVVFS